MTNIPRPTSDASGYHDAVARLAGIRQALMRADADGGGPAPDLDGTSAQVVSAASAGLEALCAVKGDAASRELVERIRSELAEISNLVLR